MGFSKLRASRLRIPTDCLFFLFISHVIQLKHHKRREPRARNIAGAEALAVARRPEEASRERNPAAAVL